MNSKRERTATVTVTFGGGATLELPRMPLPEAQQIADTLGEGKPHVHSSTYIQTTIMPTQIAYIRVSEV